MVGGAVRNALLRLPVGEIDVATTAVPEEVVRRVEAAGWQGGADRHRARHHHCRRRRPIRSRSRRCARTSRPSAARRASCSAATGRRMPSGAISPSMRCPCRPTARCHDYVGGLADIAARRVRFIGEPQTADRRRLFAHPALLSLSRVFRRGRAGRCRLARLHRRARRPRHAFARARAHGIAEAPGRAARHADACGHGRERAPRHGARRRAVSRELREHGRRSKRRSASEPDAVRRLGALGVWVTEDAERLTQRLRLVQRRSRAALGAGQLVARCAGGAASTGRARASLSARAAIVHRSRTCSPGRVRTPARPMDAGARLRACRSAGRRRRFRSRPRTSSGAASPQARRSAPPCGPPRRPGSRPIFRPTAPRSKRSPTARVCSISNYPLAQRAQPPAATGANSFSVAEPAPSCRAAAIARLAFRCRARRSRRRAAH